MATILLVDDDEIFSDEYARSLRLEGHEVWIVYSPRQAKLFAEDSEFDILITDLMMPTDGLQGTSNRFASGVYLAKELRLAGFCGPVLIFSLLPSHRIKEISRNILGDDILVYTCSKLDTDPSILPRKVEQILYPERARGFMFRLRRMFSSLILQPNFAGLGLDLRKLFRRLE